MRKVVLSLLGFVVAGCGGSSARPTAPDSATVTIAPAVPAVDTTATPDPTTPKPMTPEPTVISWETSEPRAVERARAEGRPLLVFFRAMWCGSSMEMERETFKDARVIAATARFVMLWIDATDDEAPEVESFKEKYKVVGLPTLVVFDRKEKEQARITEFPPAERLVTVLGGIK